ncbi:hypothetical protein [Metabacillus iocasae]|uniref:Uncharacterized protein n=1 Tax=Priestia iocasae TaxID=2291674 RepID=A0ABS2QXX9_9BACI|nr:hypothetical protein [Metabacillus iocasae]MBM7704339.1 hypothetical protein [Metabacillus iocasae]
MEEWLKMNQTYNLFDPITNELMKKLSVFKRHVNELNTKALEVTVRNVYKIYEDEYCIYLFFQKEWNEEEIDRDCRTENIRYMLTINDDLVSHKLYSTLYEVEILIFLQELNKNYNSVYCEQSLIHLQPFIDIQHLIDDLVLFNSKQAVQDVHEGKLPWC